MNFISDKTNKLKLVMFDFDGVLSKGRFYLSEKFRDHPDVTVIRNLLFDRQCRPLMENWMKGRLNYQRLHQQLSLQTGIGADFMDQALKESVKGIEINRDLLEFSKLLRKKGTKTVIVTDNMDIFDQETVPYHKLNNYFDKIYSSSRYGLMKNELGGEMLKLVLKDFDLAPQEAAFTDDSKTTGQIAEQMGLHFYLYENYEKSFDGFLAWLKSTFQNA